jgi:short-subunit dehydrogenase
LEDYIADNPFNTVLITGASRGIGYDLAKQFAPYSKRLVLISRNIKRLTEIRDHFEREFGVEVIIIARDLSLPHASQQIFNELNDKGIIVDVLVNNAGIGYYGFFHRESLDQISDMLQLNIVALTELTKLFLKGMVDRESGKILNISSLAAYTPGPFMAVYYASKAYVKSFSEAIADELKGTGVTVTAVCPGLTKTGFQKEIGNERPYLAVPALQASSEDVARFALKALIDGKEVAIPGILNSSLAMTTKIIPDRLKTRIVRKLQQLNRK